MGQVEAGRRKRVCSRKSCVVDCSESLESSISRYAIKPYRESGLVPHYLSDDPLTLEAAQGHPSTKKLHREQPGNQLQPLCPTTTTTLDERQRTREPTICHNKTNPANANSLFRCRLAPPSTDFYSFATNNQ